MITTRTRTTETRTVVLDVTEAPALTSVKGYQLNPEQVVLMYSGTDGVRTIRDTHVTVLGPVIGRKAVYPDTAPPVLKEAMFYGDAPAWLQTEARKHAPEGWTR